MLYTCLEALECCGSEIEGQPLWGAVGGKPQTRGGAHAQILHSGM